MIKLSIIRVDDFSALLSLMDEIVRPKIPKEMDD